MKSNNRKLAINLNTLQSEASASKAAFYCYLVLQLIAIVMFSLNEEFAFWIDQVLLNDKEIYSKGTALSKDSFSRLFGRMIWNIPNLLKNLNTTEMVVALSIVAVILGYFVWILVYDVPPKRLLKAISIILVCYSSIFLMINMLLFKVFFCKDYSIIEQSADSDVYIVSNVTKRLLQTANITEVRAIQASQNIRCYSFQHAGASMAALIGILANIALKQISDTLLKYIPDYDFKFTKTGHIGTLVDLTLSLLVIARCFVTHTFSMSIQAGKVFYSVSAIIMGGLIIIQTGFGGYIEESILLINLMKLVIGFCLMGMVVIPIGIKVFTNEFSIYAVCFIVGIIIYRLANNILRNKQTSLLKKWAQHSKSIVKVDNFELTYYYLISILHQVIKSQTKNERDTITLINATPFIYIGRYLQLHKEKCKDSDCGCSKAYLPLEFDPCGSIKKELSEMNTIKICVFILSDYLNKLKSHSVFERERLICTIAHFEAMYAGQVSSAYSMLYKSSKLKKIEEDNRDQRSIMFYRTEDVLSRICRDNVETGELGLRKILRLNFLVHQEQNKVKIVEYLEFLEAFRLIKRNLIHCIELRNKFLSEIREVGNLQVAYGYSKMFNNFCDSIIDSYEEVSKRIDFVYSPLILIYGIFQFFIYQNISSGRKYLNEYKTKEGMHKLRLETVKYSHELCLIFIKISRTNVDTIYYTTPNIDKVTGYIFKELDQKGVDILVPEPIRRRHNTFIRPKDQGWRLQNPNLVGSYSCHKTKGLVRVDISVRHTLNVINGIEFVGCITADHNIVEEIVLLVDREGIICTLNSLAKEYFDEGASIGAHSPALKDRLDKMQKLVDENLDQPASELNLQDLISRGQVDASVKYFESLHYNWINIKTRNSNILKMNICFEKQVVYSQNYNFWVLRIRDIEGEKTLHPTEHNKIRNEGERGTLGVLRMVHRAFSKSKSYLKQYDDFKEFSKMDIANEGIVKKKNQISDLNMYNIKPIALKITKKKIKEISEEKLIEEFPGSEYSNEEGRENLIFDDLLIQSVSLKGDNSDKLHKSQKIDSNDLLSDQLKNSKKDLVLSKIPTLNSNIVKKSIFKRLENFNIETSVRTSYSDDHLRINKLSFIIHTYIKPKNLHILAYVTIFSMIIVVSSLSTFAYIKVPVQQMTNVEIRDKAITLDYFSKQLWGFTQTLLILERFRFMKEGHMGLLMELRPGKPIRTRFIRAYYNQSCNVILPYALLVDAKISNINDRSLFNWDAWIATTADVHNYRINQETGRPIWFKEKMTYRGAIQFLSARMRNFYLRDYENDTLPLHGPDRDRDTDPEEELFRKNYVGDIYNKVLMRNSDFNQYLKNLASRNELYIMWTFIGSLVTIMTIMIGIWIFSIYELRSMQSFYKYIFKMKKDDLDEIANEFLSKTMFLLQSIKEERVDANLSKESIKGALNLTTKQIIASKILTAVKTNNSGKTTVSEPLKISSKIPIFGVTRMLYWFAGLMIAFCIIQILHFISIYPNSKRVTDLTKAYSLSVDTWSGYYRVLTLFTEVIAWNNTIYGGHDEPILETFESAVSYIENQILQNISDSTSYDLGTFTQEYNDLIFKGNSCETVYTLPAHPSCSKYFNGLFTGNYYNSLRGMLEVLKQEVLIWKYSRESWDIVPLLINADILQAYWNLIFPITSTIYYVLTVPLTAELMTQLDKNLAYLGVINNLVIFFLVLIFVAGIITIVVPLQNNLRSFHSLLYIIPFELLDKNILLKQNLVRIRIGELFYKLKI